MVVLVTGASGQLGQSLQFIASNYPEITFHFLSSSDLDITNLEQCKTIFSEVKPDYCINTAAYTAVDKAEYEPEKAHLINVTGAENLAKACKEFDTILLHISTDFVFDGDSSFVGMTNGFTEEDIPNPTGVYGQTKLDGERAIQAIWEKHIIIRTSWVYSQFGNNFMKTMLRLGRERDAISVVNDQIGTPTNAIDLADVLLKIVIFCHAVPKLRNVSAFRRTNQALETSQEISTIQDVSAIPPSGVRGLFGIYNFSNEGQCSWYDFAKKILEINNIQIDLKPIPTSSYPTPAKRPSYSVLDKSKIKAVFGSEISEKILSWESSLITIDFSVLIKK